MQEKIKVYEEKMVKSYEVLLDEYASIRAGTSKSSCA